MMRKLAVAMHIRDVHMQKLEAERVERARRAAQEEREAQNAERLAAEELVRKRLEARQAAIDAVRLAKS